MPKIKYNPVIEARRVYNREKCARSFEADLEAHLMLGFVFSTPSVFVMGRPVLSTALPAEILDPWHIWPREHADCWHVWLAAGRLSEMWGHLPYILPFVSFERDNVLRLHRFESLRKTSHRIMP